MLGFSFFVDLIVNASINKGIYLPATDTDTVTRIYFVSGSGGATLSDRGVIYAI